MKTKENILTSKEHKKLLDAHTTEIEKNTGYSINDFNIGSSSGDNWVSSKGHKERLTSVMDASNKVTHAWN